MLKKQIVIKVRKNNEQSLHQTRTVQKQHVHPKSSSIRRAKEKEERTYLCNTVTLPDLEL